MLEGTVFCGRTAKATVRAAALGAAIVVLIGVPLSAALNVWLDEAFTLHTTGAGALNAWSQAIVFEGQPPLYFVLESIWRTLNETSIAFARFPSVVFAAAAVALIVGAASRIAPRIPALVVALVTAFNPIVIWAAVEMRLYALLLLVGVVLTWTFYEGFVVAHPSRRAQIGYAICAIVGLYTQYYVGFVLAAQCVTLLALRRSGMRAFSAAMAFVVVAFVPFSGVVMMHVGSRDDFVARVTLSGAVHEIANAVFAFVFPHDSSWSGALKIAGFGLVAVLLIALWFIGRPVLPPSPARAVVVQWLICLAMFSVVFSTLGLPVDPLRHLVVVAPSSLLVALLCMSSLTRRRVLAGSLAITTFAGFACAQFWSQYHSPLGKQGDWQRVAAALTSDDPSAPVAVFPAELAFPLGVYLPIATIPIPKPMPFRIDYVHATTLTAQSDVSQVLDPLSARADHLWVVTSGECNEAQLVTYNYRCHFVEAYLNSRYRLARSIEFRGALARLYVRAPNVSSISTVARNAH